MMAKRARSNGTFTGEGASIGTNLLFFDKGTPTKDIWFWEHRVPVGLRSYSMTNPIRLEHLKDCLDWWGGLWRNGRREVPQAWKVTIEEVKAQGYKLAFENPHIAATDQSKPEELIATLTATEAETTRLREHLKASLAEPLAMNAKRLLAQYDHILDAPDAISRLRQFVLSLAVRGKLVPQDPNDEPVSELLKQIAAEKARLVKARKIRVGKASAPIDAKELPCAAPPNWAWLRLKDIGVLAGGMTPSMNRTDYWGGNIVWLSPKDIKADEVSDSELKITAKALSETRLQRYRPGSLFMVARSGILKRTFPVAINRVPAAANQDMKVLVPFVDGQERFLQIMFRGLTDFILRELVKTGMTVQSLKYSKFETQPWPLAPFAEQHRIVAKVDRLMAICSRLETCLSTATETRRDLLEALLAEALSPDEEGELEAAEQCHRQSTRLFSRL
jgi:hypothetical protein